jgi:hypothetical protein
MKNLVVKGSKWPLSTLSKNDRITDLTEALVFGNHNGAYTKPVLLKKLISYNIRFGYRLIIPQGKILRLSNACIAPMKIMNQFTLDAGGEIVDKEQSTHNLILARWPTSSKQVRVRELAKLRLQVLA